MKLAYLVIGHTEPQQILRLIERLRPSASLFIVHIDARADDSVFSPLAAYAQSAADVVMAPRQRCYWGTYGIVKATFACIDAALAHGTPFEYAVLLSGQDYPIKSPAAIQRFFSDHPGAEFIDAFPLDQPNRWTLQGGPYQAMARVNHWMFSWRSRRFHLPFRRRFYKQWQPFGGSQWWCLSRPALEWLNAYRRAHPSVERFFRFAFIPDEVMIQTMLANSPFRERISADPVHYVDWERPNPKYPRTIDNEDLDRLAQSSCLLARKFHHLQSAEVLDCIDQELLGIATSVSV